MRLQAEGAPDALDAEPAAEIAMSTGVRPNIGNVDLDLARLDLLSVSQQRDVPGRHNDRHQLLGIRSSCRYQFWRGAAYSSRLRLLAELFEHRPA